MPNMSVTRMEWAPRLRQAQQYDSPLDGKPCHSRFLCQDISPHSFDDGFRGGICVELLAIILVVDIVSNSNKFTLVVRTGEEDDSHPKDLGGG